MIWFIMIATGLFTFATRFIMLSNGISNRPSLWLVDALGFVPIAVLTAIIVPAILVDPADQTIALWDNPRLFAAALAIIAALVIPVRCAILAASTRYGRRGRNATYRLANSFGARFAHC